MLPEILTALDVLYASLNGKCGGEFRTSDRLLLRVLYLCSSDIVAGSPFVFKDRGSGANASTIYFDGDSAVFVMAVRKQLSIEISREYAATTLVLTSAQTKFRELEGKQTFRGLLAVAQHANTNLTSIEMNEMRGELASLSRRKQNLSSILAGKGRLRAGQG
jgi:hypothetical protein